MKAITRRRYGSTDVLELEEIPIPPVGSDEVLVRVRAAGLDRGVWHLMAGLPYLVRLAGYGVRAPTQPVLGADVAGVVEAVGHGVTRVAVGDEVLGIGRGAFAELTTVPEAKLARKPAALGFEAAAALPISGSTALQAVRDHGRVRPGQHVAVLGAAGGVGSYAVQIAKAFGAEVTGVCSTTKVDLVRALGADHVVDYTEQDVTRRPERYDVVLDIAGNRSVSALRRVLTPRGTLVIVGGEGGDRLTGGLHRQLSTLLLSPFVRHRLRTFINRERAADIEALVELVEAGEVTPCIDRTYPLAEVPEAIRHLTGGHARGKVVITV